MKYLRRHYVPWLVMLAGAVVSVLAYELLQRAEQKAVRLEFSRRCQVLGSVIESAIREHEDSLYNLRNHFNYSDDVTRDEFAGLAGDLIQRHPGIHALEWVQRVPGGQRSAVETAMRSDGFPDFQFTNRGDGPKLVRAREQEEYFPVLLVHPLIRNQAALGFDLTSGGTWKSMERAASANSLSASGRLPLITDGNSMDWGYILSLPVYTLPLPTESAARRSSLRGFVLGIFRLSELVESAVGRIERQGSDLMLVDEAAAPENQLLHFHRSRYRKAKAPNPSVEEMRSDPLAQNILLPVADRRWEILFRPAPEWLAGQQTQGPLTVLLVGLFASVLAARSIRSTLHRTELVEHLVLERTAQLRESEDRFHAVLDHSPALIFVKDLEGRYILFNQPFEAICGRQNKSITHCTDFDLFPEAQATAYQANDRAALAAGRPIVVEEAGWLDGKQSIWMVHKFPLMNAAGQPYALCGIATDITERKQAELELHERRRQLSNLISQLPGAAFRCQFDQNLTALFASEGMLSLTGVTAEELMAGRVHLAELTVPADRVAVRAAVSSAIAERRQFEVEYRILHRDGHERWVLVRGRPVYEENCALRFIEGLAIDVTALKLAEAEKIAFERNLKETQKLESLGVLAGGIAHDFNNLLTAILGNASLMRYSQPQSEASTAHLEQIEKAARRAADLCTQMLAYAGKGKVSSGRIDLSRLVRDTTALLEISIGKNCRLDLGLAENLPAVLGDATQLRQIVMNLVINSSDAIGQRADGKISVRTFEKTIDSSDLRSALHQPKLESGVYVGLEVRDNGCGMSDETMTRIFEPFFTTKFSGRGLGLSAVLGIVQSHRGALFVESQPNQGSTFRLLLPAEPGPAAEPAATAKTLRPQTLRGTILVVDDEDSVRSMVAKVLAQHGAAVLQAANGTEALAQYRQHHDKIGLILLDLTMPGLTGEEILVQLQEFKAGQKIVIMSGYSEEETMNRFAELGVVGFISKPFELAAMVAKIQALLD